MRLNRIERTTSHHAGRPAAGWWSMLLAVVAAGASVFAGARASAQFGRDAVPQVDVSAKLASVEAAPGGQLVLAVVMDHGDDLHSWPSADQDVLPPDIAEFAIRTAISVGDADWIAAVGPVQWPEPKPAPVPNLSGQGPPTVEVPTYKGRAIAYIPLLVAQDAAEGATELVVTVELQACDDTNCYMPQDEARTLAVVLTASPGASPADSDFAAFDASVFADLTAGDAPPSGTDGETVAEAQASGDEGTPEGSAATRPKFLGVLEVPEPGSAEFLPVLIAFGFAGGFLLNLMPCVLPVIPLKIMTLTQHAGESRGRALMLGLWMFIGVTAFWSALALPVVMLDTFGDPSQLFGIWWVTAGIGAVIFVMSFGLLGFYNINLPQKAYMISPTADSPSGSFMFGVMTAVLGLPCFGVIVGALLPQATVAGSAASVAMFVSMGVGMGLPYVVLAAFPGLVSRVPKAGPASDLIKQVMSLLLMAAGAYFVGSGLIGLVLERPYVGKVLHWWAAGLFVAFAGLWLFYKTIRITKTPLPMSVFGFIALVLIASGVWVADDFTDQERTKYEDRKAALAAAEAARAGGGPSYITTAWNDFTPGLFEEAVDDGRVVVMDFTAEWCLNCKALKRTVLNVDPIKPLLMGEGVVPVTVDLTARSAPGWAKLRELGQTGIPTLAVFGPGFPDGPWISNAYTSGQVLDAIERAKGDRVAHSGS